MKYSKLLKILTLSILLLTTWFVSQELRSNVEKQLSTRQIAQLNEIGPAKSVHTLPTDIRIGGAFPIVSRPEAGRDRRDAFLMAIYEINNQTGTDRILPEGINLVPKIVDNPELGDQAAAQALILWGADIVIGPSRSSATEIMTTELTPHRIPVISATATASTLSNRTLYPYFLRVLPSTADNAMALADFVKTVNWTKGATIHSDDLFSSDSIQDFIEIFEKRNGTILTDQSFTTGDTDVSAQILAIKNAAPEFVLGTFVDPPNAVTLEAKLQKIENYTWIGGLNTSKAIGIEESPQGPAFEAFNSSWFDPAWNWLEGPADSQSSGTAFDYPGGGLTPFVYDAVYVAAKGLAAAGTTDGIDLTEALYDITHEGASQYIKFNQLGEMWGRYNYVQFENNVPNTFGEWFGTPYIETTLTLADGTILTIDTIPPDLSIDSPLAQTYQTDTITVNLSSDAAVHYWYFIESVDSQNRTWTTSVDRTLPDGIYILHAYGNDSAGNIAYAKEEFTLDTIPPDLSIDSPLAQTYQTDTITVTLSGDAVHYWYFIESVDSQNRTWTTSVDRTLPDGIYVLHTYGNDSAGNIAYAKEEFILDTIPPDLSIDSPLAQTYQTDTITVTLSGDAVHYWYFIESVDSQNRTWTTSVDRTLPDGFYVLHAYGNDSASNVAHVLYAFTIDIFLTSTTTTTTTPSSTDGVTPGLTLLLVPLSIITLISFKRRKKTP